MAQARNLELFKFRFLLFIAFLENSNFEIFKFGTLEKSLFFLKITLKKFGYIKKNPDLYYRNEERSPHKETKKLQTFKITKL